MMVTPRQIRIAPLFGCLLAAAAVSAAWGALTDGPAAAGGGSMRRKRVRDLLDAIGRLRTTIDVERHRLAGRLAGRLAAPPQAAEAYGRGRSLLYSHLR